MIGREQQLAEPFIVSFVTSWSSSDDQTERVKTHRAQACLGSVEREHERAVGEHVRDLDGLWHVRRTGGFLPPLVGVRKRILGARGETALGPLPGFPFTVDGLRLRYRAPLRGFVDELEPAADGFRGRATFRGRPFGTFELRREGS